MTLLEYVQSLQEQGVTDIPNKVQEWKKKNQPKVEEEKKPSKFNKDGSLNVESFSEETRGAAEKVNEGKNKGAAEADANVAPVENSSSSTGASLLRALDKNYLKTGENPFDSKMFLKSWNALEDFDFKADMDTEFNILEGEVGLDEYIENENYKKGIKGGIELDEVKIETNKNPFSLSNLSKGVGGAALYADSGNLYEQAYQQSRLKEFALANGATTLDSLIENEVVELYGRGEFNRGSDQNLFHSRGAFKDIIGKPFRKFEGINLKKVNNYNKNQIKPQKVLAFDYNNGFEFNFRAEEITSDTPVLELLQPGDKLSKDQIQKRINELNRNAEQDASGKNVYSSEAKKELEALYELMDEIGGESFVPFDINKASDYWLNNATNEYINGLGKEKKASLTNQVAQNGIDSLNEEEKNIREAQLQLRYGEYKSEDEKIKLEEYLASKEEFYGTRLYDENGQFLDFEKASTENVLNEAVTLTQTTDEDELKNNLFTSNTKVVKLAKIALQLNSERAKADLGSLNKQGGRAKGAISEAIKILDDRNQLSENQVAMLKNITSTGLIPKDFKYMSGDTRSNKAFNEALLEYDVINTALQLNKNPLAVKNRQYAKGFVNVVGEIANSDYGGSFAPITLRKKEMKSFSQVLQINGYNQEDLNFFKKNQENNWGEDLISSVTHLTNFGFQLYAARGIGLFDKYTKVMRAGETATNLWLKGKGVSNAFVVNFPKYLAGGFIEGGEFAGLTIAKNIMLDQDESAPGAAKFGFAMGFGGKGLLALTGALSKRITQFAPTPIAWFANNTGQSIKMLNKRATEAFGGATTFMVGSAITDPYNTFNDKFLYNYSKEFFNMFIYGGMSRALTTKGGTFKAAYNAMQNDYLGFSKLNVGSKKGLEKLKIDDKSIVQTPTTESNEIVNTAVDNALTEVATKLENKEINEEQAAQEIIGIEKAQSAVSNQIVVNQIKAIIKEQRASEGYPTEGERYRTMQNFKNGKSFTDRDSQVFKSMSPEEILLSLGSKGTKENIAEIESYQNREVSIQSMLDGGGVKVVLAGGGFEFIEPYKYKVDKSNKKLRNKVYEFLRKKFNINDKLQIILASNKSKLSPLEKEFQKELIEELENSLNEYKKGGVKEIEIQKEINEGAAKELKKSKEQDLQDQINFPLVTSKGEVKSEYLSESEFIERLKKEDMEASAEDVGVTLSDGTLVYNETKMKTIKDFSVQSHEKFGHAIFFDTFKDSKGLVTEDGIKFIDEMLAILPDSQKKKIIDEVARRYPELVVKDKKEWYEENLGVIAEYMRDGKIKYEKSIGEKIKDVIPFYKDKGFDNLDIQNPADAFKLMQGAIIGKSEAKKRLSETSIEEAGKKLTEQYDIDGKKVAKQQPKKSKAKESETVLQAIDTLIPRDVKTKKEYDKFIRDPRKNTKVFESLMNEGGAINNYIRSKSTSKEEAQKAIENLQDRMLNFNPEALRADGKKVGVEGFGESIFANTRFAKLFAKSELFKESEKKKQEKRQDDNTLQLADKSTSSSRTEEVDTDVKLVDNIKVNKNPLSVDFKNKVREFVTKQLESVDVNSEKFRKQVFKPSKAFVDFIAKDLIGSPKKFREFLNENPTFYKALNITDLVAIDNGRVKKGQPRLFTELNRRLTKQSEIEKFMMQGRVPYLTTTQQKAGANLYNRLNPKVAAVVNNFFGSTPQNNSNRKNTIAKIIAKKFIAEAAPSTELFKAKTSLDKAKTAEKLQVSPEAKFKKVAKVMASKVEIIRGQGFAPVERGKVGVDRTREFVLGGGSDVFGVELTRALIATNNVYSTAGNRAYSYNKDGSIKRGGGAIGGGYNFITDVARLLSDYGPKAIKAKMDAITKKQKDGKITAKEALEQKKQVKIETKFYAKTVKDTLALIEAGELGDLSVLQKELSATKKEGIFKADEIALIKKFLAHKNAKSGGIENNTTNIAEINKGKKLMLDAFKKIYEADNSTFPLIADASYSFNSNKNPFRELATLVGGMEGLKKGTKTWEEHMMQFGMYTNEMLKALKGSDKAWNSFVDWSNNNYYQLRLSKEASDLIDKNFVGIKGLEDWNAKSQFHRLQRESFEIAEKTGDYSKVIDPMIRAYNEYVNLNPFSITRLGITDAKRYLNNVEISKTDQKNLTLQNEAAKLINQVIRSEAGFLKEGNPDYVTRKQAGERLLASENLAKGQGRAAELANKILPKQIKYNEPISVEKGITALAKTDTALANGRKLNAPVKKIRALDFDFTVGVTKSNVLYTMPDGKTGKIDAAAFAKEAGNMEKLGAKWDFSEFSKVMEGEKGPLFEVMKTIFEKRGGKDLFILTARPSDAAGPIKEFLESLGVNIPIENITGLGNGSPEAKAGWIMGKAAEGYNDFYFADDHIGNVKAVKEVLSQLDVKSKVQQAKFSKAKTFDTIVNDMIKESAGIETYKEYSAAKAKTVGASKGKYNFLIPASAEDFTGLLYKMLGKGKKGDAQMAFLKTNLLDTYDRAESAVTQAKIAAANDFKALKTNLKTLPTSLSKPTGIGGFTFSHAVRVAAWTAQGMEVPGLSKRDIKDLNDFVNKNAELKVFTNELLKIQKGKLYPKPGKEWLGGNITSDIINDINKVNRAEYQQEWRENADIIFSEANMNKMEAAYGTRWREAMEDSLRRMKSGSNRPPGGNRATDGILDWLNNSVGAVMFLNTRSALLQTISAVNFINWGDNNIAKAGAAFANQPQYWKDFMQLMNSDYLVERRNGLKINVSESEIADAVRDSGNKPKAAIAFLLSKGFVMTRFADSFAIAAGGSTFYRNRVKTLLGKGMEKEAAEAQAFEDFRQIAEESQQSSNPNRISMQQASTAGRVILAWANTPMQYARIQKRAAQDLINGRGDWKTNVSKIAYYGAVQNLIFNSLQQAVFALGFGEDDDAEKQTAKEKEKIYRVANGMIDSQLKGLGIGGAAVVALKSALMELGKQHAKDRPKYEEAVFDLLGFSPPLGSKVQKISGGLRSFSWNMKDIKDKGFSLDNPAYLAGAQITTGLTNIPLDRVVKKLNSMRGIVNEQSALWQKVALGLGWSTWDVGLGYYGGFDAAKVLTPEEEKVKEIDDMKKLTKTQEQVDMLLDLGLTKKEIKALGKEQSRVEKIIELQNAEAKPKEETKVKEEIKEETKPTPEVKAKPKTESVERRLRRQFDSIKDENKPDQVKTLLKFGLTKKQIRTLQYEKNRVNKILELMEKNK